MSGRVLNPYSQFLDDDGIPVESGTVTFFINQTTTLATIYSDLGQSVPQANPYSLDANGRITGDVYFSGSMTMELRDVNGGLIRTDDNVVTAGGGAGGGSGAGSVIFETSLQMKAASVVPATNIKTNGLNILLDGGNADYYVLTLADYGGIPPDESTSPDVSLANTNVAVRLADSVLPRLGIIQYHGSITDIPAGWSLCDGFNGTPNLSGLFVIGTSIPGEQGDTGGTTDISLPAATDDVTLTANQSGLVGHAHGDQITNLNNGAPQGNFDGGGGGGNKAGSTTAVAAANAQEAHAHGITYDGTNANLPPYYKIAFIMRTGEIKQVVQPAPPEQSASYIGVSGAVELDAEFGAITVFIVQPGGVITNLSIINPPTELDSAYGTAIKIISDGSSGVTWDPMFKWQLATPPTLTLNAGNYDLMVGLTTDYGVTYGTSYALGDMANAL